MKILYGQDFKAPAWVDKDTNFLTIYRAYGVYFRGSGYFFGVMTTFRKPKNERGAR